MSELQRYYQAHVYLGGLSIWHPDDSASVYCTDGELSTCGQWIEIRTISADKQRHETIRHEVGPLWQPTKEAAQAAIAEKLRAIGETLIRQADEIIAANKEKTVASS